MNQVAVREEICFDAVLKDVETMQNMCASLMRTKHYRNMGEDGVFAIVQKAKSLNIHPLEALNGGLYFVQGKVGMSTEMMTCLIRQKGHSIIKDDRSNDKICILKGKRADNGDTWTITFSIEDAKRAGLIKNMWDKYPAVMLYNRAMSMLARQLFPDVIKGAGYTQDELFERASNMQPSISHQKEEVVIEHIERITDQQASELIEILSECKVDYQRSVMDFIRKPPVSINSLLELPVSLYDRVRNAAIKKRDEEKENQLVESEEIAAGE